MNIEQTLLLIVALCIIIFLTLIHSIKGFKIQWHRFNQCYCIYYEILVDRYDSLADENQRELKLVVKKLPKFLNIFKPKKK